MCCVSEAYPKLVDRLTCSCEGKTVTTSCPRVPQSYRQKEDRQWRHTTTKDYERPLKAYHQGNTNETRTVPLVVERLTRAHTGWQWASKTTTETEERLATLTKWDDRVLVKVLLLWEESQYNNWYSFIVSVGFICVSELVGEYCKLVKVWTKDRYWVNNSLDSDVLFILWVGVIVS